jgi:thiamine-monophosphate kinase
MALSEFDIIERYFRRHTTQRDDVVLGIGDDAALLQVPADRQLVVAMDTLVAGRHFPPQTTAFDVGWKALAVNLSDLAAMGASPAWATLSLTMPAADEVWLEGFARGFFQLAERYQVELVGGDTTRGPLSVTVQLHGLVERGKALRRAAARAGQKLFVTGTLGDAACALQALQADGKTNPDLLQRLNRPEPRVDFGLALAGVGAAAIDISDGLLADLGHILDASCCGATLWVDRLPRSPALDSIQDAEALACQLYGGDDYELCFSVDAEQAEQINRFAGDRDWGYRVADRYPLHA